MKKIISTTIILSLLQPIFSCGYIIHEERRGQKAGKIDWVIVGLDAIGLLFFILPGAIAFAIDIGTGTIYLPSGQRASIMDLDHATQIKVKGEMNEENVRLAIKEQTGIDVDFNDPRLKIFTKDKILKEGNS